MAQNLHSRYGKRYRQALTMIGKDKLYSLQEAGELLGKLPAAKFDESIDIALKLGVDPRKAEENVRGTVTLPHGTGKTLRVAVFCKSEKMKEAQDAGADFVGAEDLIAKVQEGWLGFDATVATPDVMVLLSKVAKILGPRGLMPNPKLGTVTFDLAKTIKAIKAGRVEYRVEKGGIIHVAVGKVSFGAQKIAENVFALIETIIKAKPKSSKGVYLESIFMSTTMGPSIGLDPVPFRSSA